MDKPDECRQIIEDFISSLDQLSKHMQPENTELVSRLLFYRILNDHRI